MAGFRQFETKFWKDEWVSDLIPLKKLLYSYLFTNESSSISGLYEISLKVIVNETGLKRPFIEECLAEFQAAEKIVYSDSVMWVVNMQKYHKNASPKTVTKVNRDVEKIKDCLAKRAYLHYKTTGKYCIDTVSIHDSEREREREREIKKERESEIPPAQSDISPIQLMIEQISGLPPANHKDIIACDEMEKLGATREDIQNAYVAYCKSHDFRYYASIVGWVRTEVAKRLQVKKGSVFAPPTEIFTNPVTGEVLRH